MAISRESILIDAEMPGQERCRELADAFEAISEESDDADEGIDNDDDVRELCPATLAETGLNPLGAGHYILFRRSQVER